MDNDHHQHKSERDPLIDVQHLSVVFGQEGRNGFFRKQHDLIKAVDDLTLQIYESEVVSLVGESGSGKTTVARCLMGLARPASGKIICNGKDVSNFASKSALREHWKEVQLIYQDPFESMNPRWDVSTVISEPLRRLARIRNESEIHSEVNRLVDEVGLTQRVLQRLPHELSGGERQRVNIARALATKPKILIADEPITMLDATLRLSILSLLMDLKKKMKLTILLITHDLASAKIMSDRTAIMYLGKLVEIGPTSDVLRIPRHPYTELILDSTPRTKRANPHLFYQERSLVTSGGGGLELIPRSELGCIFRPRCKYATEKCREAHPPMTGDEHLHLVSCYNPLKSSSASDRNPLLFEPAKIE